MDSENAASHFMNEALKAAREAARRGEVPVGAVIVKNGEIVAIAANRTEELKNPLAHAEMLAINKALAKTGGWRLTGCDMYVTLEPCAMCAGAIVHARIENVYIGAADPKTGACGSVMNIVANPYLNHHPHVETGICGQECSNELKDFFRDLRRK